MDETDGQRVNRRTDGQTYRRRAHMWIHRCKQTLLGATAARRGQGAGLDVQHTASPRPTAGWP
jgi:hypothetical protein